MASVATGPRFSQARRLSAFVAAFALVGGLLGALAPGALAAGPQPTVTIGANSCIGQDACKGATGNIGANSCNGHQACYMAAADIGDSSCNGDQACADAKGQVADRSCNGLWACGPASFEPYV